MNEKPRGLDWKSWWIGFFSALAVLAYVRGDWLEGYLIQGAALAIWCGSDTWHAVVDDPNIPGWLSKPIYLACLAILAVLWLPSILIYGFIVPLLRKRTPT